jgi:hypothetical protein
MGVKLKEPDARGLTVGEESIIVFAEYIIFFEGGTMSPDRR